MNEQIKYYGMSAGLHGAVVALMIALAMGAVAHKEIVTIDFSLDDSPAPCESMQTKQPMSTPPASPPTRPEPPRQMIVQQASPIPTVSSPVAPVEPIAQPVTNVVETSVASARQRVESITATVVTAPASNFTRTATATTTGNSSIGESGIEQVHKKYLKEHFNYIRELIMKRLDYPLVARRMEWTGKVVLAFVVSEDGEVHSIEVKESSGHAVLDNSAIDTVKRVSPFPRPPVAVKIVMPVHFKLQ